MKEKLDAIDKKITEAKAAPMLARAAHAGPIIDDVALLLREMVGRIEQIEENQRAIARAMKGAAHGQ